MRILFVCGFFALCASIHASAQPPLAFMQAIADIQGILNAVGSALGAVMIAWEGVKWITADNPAERENAKKGVIYIMIGLVLLKSSERIVTFLLVVP